MIGKPTETADPSHTRDSWELTDSRRTVREQARGRQLCTLVSLWDPLTVAPGPVSGA